MIRLLSLFIMLCCSFASTAQQPVFEKHSYITGSDTLPYRLVYPYNYNPARSYPLVVFLHGSSLRGSDNERQLRYVPDAFTDAGTRKKYPCFLLIPQCPGQDSWANFPRFPASLKTPDTPTTASKILLQLIVQMKASLPVDNNRIYLTGYSMGGEGSFDLMARAPAMFAAAVPVCAVADTSTAAGIKHIPIWVFHGKLDEVNPVTYSRIMVKALEDAGGKPRYTEYDTLGHRCWQQAYGEPELLPWLFAQKKKD